MTGGASGLGRATVNRFANKGAQVVFCDLETSKGAEVAKDIGENVHYIPADVRSEKDVDSLVKQISSKYGKLNVLVNCAGVADAHVIYNFASNKPRLMDDVQRALQVISILK